MENFGPLIFQFVNTALKNIIWLAIHSEVFMH